MSIDNLRVVWKLLLGGLLAAEGSVALGWVWPAAPSKVDCLLTETLQCAQRERWIQMLLVLLGRKAGKRTAVVLADLSLPKYRF